MQFSRRDFLRSSLVACGSSVPLFLARSATLFADGTSRPNDGRVLVVVELDGGNDGLNTVVPYQDDEYRRRRPRLAIAAREVHRLDDRVGLHPSLTGLLSMHENRQLAIVQSVGYPNPNRSHFESMAIWQTARLNATRNTAGWLARCVDERFNTPGAALPALYVGDTLLPQALYGGRRHVPSVADIEQFHRRLGIADLALARTQRTALDQISSRERGADGSLLQYIERTGAITYATSSRLETVARGGNSAASYPENYGLARRLKMIGQLIKAGLGTRIYYARMSGFDTHANQLDTHANLLREVGDSLKAFMDDMNQVNEAGRILMLIFSEFGRRLSENASGGTDHGTAAPVFLLGPAVVPGLHGPYPNLTDLVEGDPRHAVDFRQVYATILDRWLGCPSQPVLGERFGDLALLRATAGSN